MSSNQYNLALIVIFLLGMWLGDSKAKYEGWTAEEWFNQYDYCIANLEDYSSCVVDTVPEIEYYCSP